MRCNEVQELLEQYYSGDIEQGLADELKEHLNSCSGCSEIFKEVTGEIEQIRNFYSEIEIPKELEDIDKLVPKRTVKRKFNFGKAAAAAGIIMILAGALNYQTLADNLRRIPYPQWLRSMGGENVVNSLEKGFGQSVELSDINEGIEMTVHNVVIEEEKTRVIFSIKGITGSDAVRIEKILIKDEKGRKLLEGGAWSSRYDDKNGTMFINFEGQKLDKKANNIYFEVKGLVGLGAKNKELDIPLGESSDLPKTIEVESEVYKSFNLKSIESIENRLIINYEVQYFDHKDSGHLTPHMELKSGGKTINMVSSSVSSREAEQTRYIQEIFNFEGEDLNQARLHLNYYEISWKSDKTWSVGFSIDKNTVYRSIYEKKIGKTLQIGDTRIIIEKIVATPTGSRIILQEKYSEGKFSKPGEPAYLPEIGILSEGRKQTAYRWRKQEDGKEVYEFGPVEHLEDLVIQIEKAVVSVNCDERVRLANVSDKKQKLQYSIDGFPFNISYLKENGSLKIDIYSSREYQGEVGEVELVNVKPVIIERHFLSHEETITRITAENFSGDSVELHIQSYTKIINPDIEIKLME